MNLRLGIHSDLPYKVVRETVKDFMEEQRGMALKTNGNAPDQSATGIIQG
jgi:hypothetical protein